MKPKSSLSHFLALAGSSLFAMPFASAVDGTWSNGNGGNWSTSSNWSGSPNPVPGGQSSIVSITADITGARTVTINTTSRTVGFLTIGDSSHGYTIAASGGASLIFDNGLSDATLTENFNTGLADFITAPITLNSNLAITTNGLLTVSGGISGLSQSITKSGAGTLRLEGSADYTGTTTISAGTLQLGVGGTSGSLTGTSSITNNANLTVNRSDTFTQATDLNNKAITGIGSFTQAGAGTTTLSLANSYTGITTVQQGNVIAGASSLVSTDGAFGNAASEIVFGVANGNNAAAILTGDAFTIGRNIRNATANGTDSGTRVLTLGGNTAHNSEFSGSIFLGTSAQTSKGIQLTAAAGGQVTFSGVIQETGGTRIAGEISAATALDSVTKVGTGTVILTNANTYLGKTVVNEGKLLVSNSTGSATGTGLVNLSGGATTTLSGTGISTGLLTVTNSSRIAAGINTTGTNGNFGVAGTLSLGTLGGMTLTSANLDFDLASSTTVGGGVNDLILTGSALTLTGSEAFTFNLLNATLDTATAYTLISGASSFSFASGDTSTWTTNFVNSSAYTANYSFNVNALQVTFSAIPEPSTALLGALGMLLLFRRRR